MATYRRARRMRGRRIGRNMTPGTPRRVGRRTIRWTPIRPVVKRTVRFPARAGRAIRRRARSY